MTEELRPDLLLCPFTVPYFWRPGVPCVSIVYDLQDVTYPEFFTAEQRLNRQRHIADACARSARVVCISDYVRGTLLASADVRSEQVVTIRLGLLDDFRTSDTEVCEKLGVDPGDFLLYPANYWQHKNHLTLFQALRIHRQRYPASRLKLVCTGAPNARTRTLQTEAASMLPSGAVIFAGYLSRAELHALFDSCRALIYPSLYEGFGLPILEAMARARPVLCSNVTSLSEVAGDAAIYFDPNDAEQIAVAITALDDETRIAGLVERGLRRAAALGTGRDMAQRYLALFQQVMAPAAA
ncbi:MAG TPA: glycosyltransferase family 1 protein [Chloroflexota bacterium]|nr:glycosyltransferase family 1 protein [Chloroflexota bacterium]